MNAYDKLKKEIAKYEKSIKHTEYADPIELLKSKFGFNLEDGDLIGIVHFEKTGHILYLYALYRASYNKKRRKLIIVFIRDGKIRSRIYNGKSLPYSKADSICEEEGFMLDSRSVSFWSLDEYNERLIDGLSVINNCYDE